MNSLEPNTEFNRSKYPVVDRNGKPFTPGCRVKFRVQTHYINTIDGNGAVIDIDSFGSVLITSDRPVTKYGPQGGYRTSEIPFSTKYAYNGPYHGKLVCSYRLGDPHEHGTTECYVEII